MVNRGGGRVVHPRCPDLYSLVDGQERANPDGDCDRTESQLIDDAYTVYAA